MTLAKPVEREISYEFHTDRLAEEKLIQAFQNLFPTKYWSVKERMGEACLEAREGEKHETSGAVCPSVIG